MGAIEAEFPSDEWFTELVRRATEDQAAIERSGIAELRFGVEILDDRRSPTLYGLVLDGYDIQAVGRVDEKVFAPDVVMTGPVEAWREMISSIEAHGCADTGHTLNGLTIAGVPFDIRAEDAMGHDKFFRYMGTLQALFDSAGSPELARSGSAST